MKLTLAGNDYSFSSVELGGKTEDGTAFLLLKNSSGEQVANFGQLSSLEGFLFTEVLQDIPEIVHRDIATLVAVALSATAQEGVEITATATYNATPDGTPTLYYQWQISSDGSTWADIAEATSATYTPVTADVDKYVRLLVSASGCAVGKETSAASVQIIAAV